MPVGVKREACLQRLIFRQRLRRAERQDFFGTLTETTLISSLPHPEPVFFMHFPAVCLTRISPSLLGAVPPRNLDYPTTTEPIPH